MEGTLTISRDSFSPSVINPGSQSITVKLEDNNFLLWKQQVVATLRGYGLKGYIDGSQSVPARNTPEFEVYDRQDQLLVSWILSSISSQVLPNLVGCETTREVWESIDEYFASQTSANVMQYRRELQSIKKGSLSMKDYLLKVKSLWDTLQSCGCKMPENELVHIALVGLGQEYDAIVAAISTQKELPTWKTTSALLFATESRNLQNSSFIDASISVANVAIHHRKPSFFDNGRGTRGFLGDNRGVRGRGRSRGRGMSGNKPQCQLCGKLGHTVHKCFHRFDISFNPDPGESFLYSRTNSVAYPKSEFGYPRSEYGHQEANFTEALIATPNTIVDSAWYPDSGATNHVTNALQNLNVGSKYHGSGKLHIGNRDGLNISGPYHQGSTLKGDT